MIRKQHTPKHRQTYTADTKAKAKTMYLRGLYLTEISVLLQTPVRTLENWQTAEKWTAYKETFECKQRAFELYKSGKKQQTIANLMQVSKATISRWIKTAKNSAKKSE